VSDEQDLPPKVASWLVIIPITGLIGGLIIGLVAARISTSDELTTLRAVTKLGVAGFCLACVSILAAASLRRSAFKSLKGLVGLVAVASVLSWFVIRILFAVLE
jgi:hypothetical protein